MARQTRRGEVATGQATPLPPVDNERRYETAVGVDNNDEQPFFMPAEPQVKGPMRPSAPTQGPQFIQDFRPRPVSPWMRPTYRPPEPPQHLANVDRPRFNARQVMEQNPEFVAALREQLGRRIASMDPNDHGPFERSFATNPEGGAASVAARFMELLRPFEGERPPTFDVALANKLRANEMWNWLGWLRQR